MSTVATIGNATLIAYDELIPIITTDPWFGDEDHAYFGSWSLKFNIPKEIEKDIFNCEYIFFTHGHPRLVQRRNIIDRIYYIFFIITSD